METKLQCPICGGRTKPVVNLIDFDPRRFESEEGRALKHKFQNTPNTCDRCYADEKRWDNDSLNGPDYVDRF